MISLTTAVALVLSTTHINPRDCAALVVFSEARSESFLGQALVAQVLVNRARDSGEGLCEEMERYKQFHGVENWPFPRRPWDIDEVSWEQSKEAANAAVDDAYVSSPNECKKARYFHTVDVVPPYAAGMKELCRVGRHVFMVKE